MGSGDKSLIGSGDKASPLTVSSLSTDTINEQTSTAGVTIDGVLLKDSGLPVYRTYLPSIFQQPTATYNLTMTAKECYIVPIEVPFTCTVDKICVVYCTTVAGNIRAGIYEDNGDTPVGGSLAVESASVAKTGTDRIQEIAITATQLTKGLYWIVVQSDESTTKLYRNYGAWLHSNNPRINQHEYTLGAYGAFTDPCPATGNTATNNPSVYLHVSAIP